MKVSEKDVSGLSGDSFQTKVAEVLRELTSAVNGGLAFKENIQCNLVDVTFGANTNTQVEHGLGKAPTGYIVCKRSAACSVYDGTNPNTAKHLFVRSSAAASVKLLVF